MTRWRSLLLILLLGSTLTLIALAAHSPGAPQNAAALPGSPTAMRASSTPTPSPTFLVLSPLMPGVLSTSRPTATSTPSPTTTTATPLLPTLTPSPTSGPLLEEPFTLPNGQQLVIHQVKRGESYFVLEQLYHTSREAIQAINWFLPSPLWEGWLLLIPVNTVQIDQSQWPAFEIFLVADQPVMVDTLAAQFQIAPDDLRRYNALEQDIIPPGRWILIPHTR